MPGHQRTGDRVSICVSGANCPGTLQLVSTAAEWAARYLKIPDIQTKGAGRQQTACKRYALSLKMTALLEIVILEFFDCRENRGREVKSAGFQKDYLW